MAQRQSAVLLMISNFLYRSNHDTAHEAVTWTAPSLYVVAQKFIMFKKIAYVVLPKTIHKFQRVKYRQVSVVPRYRASGL